ncbi:DUF456 domain-containing protein [Viridibacillus sp. NPDC093762]|uniref:DUF456 domain-containing protein n=1 Tax=Viridibacillus sp. NPDC093762 TaxID=3390720 RepID=UPI003D068F92
MDIIAWILITLSFIIAFVGLIYPIVPSVLFILLGFILYGVFYSFGDLPWWFWVIQLLFVVLLFGADTLANAFGVKKFGGSNAGMWGSTIGLLIGPFVIPIAGILLGPFLGAVLAELIVNRSSVKQAILTGIGSLVGFLTSIITKGIIQIIMIVIFVIVI